MAGGRSGPKGGFVFLLCTYILLLGCDLTHPPCMAPSQVCTKAPVQQQYSSQNVREIEHCFIALGEALSTAGAAPHPTALAQWEGLKLFFLLQLAPTLRS